jgi:diacylglycerol kinase (ATP)
VTAAADGSTAPAAASRRIGVIVNPHASGNRRHGERAAAFERIAGDAGLVRVTHDIQELRRALAEFRDAGIEILALCGGDGSISNGLCEALAVWQGSRFPKVLVLRGGTINNISRSVGGPRRPEAGLERAVRMLREGRSPETSRRPMLAINGERHGYIFGAGLITHFLELYYEAERPGPLRAAWLLVVLGCSWLVGGEAIARVVPTLPAVLEADGTKLPHPGYTLILASGVENIGLGVRPFYRVRQRSDAFHVMAGEPTPGQLLGRLYRFWRGLPPQLDPLYDGSAQRLEIRFETPQRYTIDGELFGPDPTLTIETGPTVEFLAA